MSENVVGFREAIYFLLFLSASARAAGDVSGLVESNEALEDARHHRAHGQYSLTASASFQSPSLNNLDSHLSSLGEPHPSDATGLHQGRHSRNSSESTDLAAGSQSAGGRSENAPGYRMKYSVAAGYQIIDAVMFGPVVGFSEPFYGRNSNKFLLDDPQLRLTFLELAQGKIGDNVVHVNLLISGQIPVSDQSRRRSLMGSLSISTLPRMHFRGTKYSLSLSSSIRSSRYGRNDGDALISTRLQDGILGGFHLSRQFQSELMFYGNIQLGPDVPASDPEHADALSHSRGERTLGLTTSVLYQATQNLSFTPRLNWYLDQPARMTTVSISAMMRLI